MVKAIEVPEDDEDRLRIIVFACENDAYPALDMSGMKRNGINHMVRIIPVRCLGSVNMAWIRDALSAGMDGAMLLGCTYGDNYQCHFVKGSEIANKRMENIGDTLSSLGLESERCAAEQVAITDYDKIPMILNDFVDQIVEMVRTHSRVSNNVHVACQFAIKEIRMQLGFVFVIINSGFDESQEEKNECSTRS